MGQFARFGFRGRRKSFFMNVCVVVRARVCCAMRVRVRCDVELGGDTPPYRGDSYKVVCDGINLVRQSENQARSRQAEEEELEEGGGG